MSDEGDTGSADGVSGSGPASVAASGAPVWTRRRALLAVGTAGGVGVLAGALGALGLSSVGDGPARLDRPTASGFALQGRVENRTVVVLGAGVAGLCCAYELGRAGYRVIIVEAADRVGGRNLTLRSGDEVHEIDRGSTRCQFVEGRWMNAGPARIAQHHLTVDYCRELGVSVEPFVNLNPQSYVVTEQPARRRRSVEADLAGYVSELLAKSIAADVLDDELAAGERGRLIRFLRDVGEVGRADRGYRTPPGIEPGEVDDATPLGSLLRLGMGERLRFERGWDQEPVMLQPVGGMDAIVDAFVAHLDADIRLGQRAVAVDSGDHVAVRTIDATGAAETIEADYGICTLPPPIAADIMRDRFEDLARALDEPQPVRTGKIGLEYDRRFWELDDRIYGGISLTPPETRTIWYPSHDYHANGGVLIGGYPFGSAAQRFHDSTHQRRLDDALRHGRLIHRDAYSDTLRSSISVNWTGTPHIQAGWYVWPRYGVGYKAALAGASRWHLAGDWLTRTPGWQHGALTSARHTAIALHEQALREEPVGTS